MSPDTAKFYTFRMASDASPLEREHPTFVQELSTYVNESLPVGSKDEYLAFIAGITDIIGRHKEELDCATPLFDKEIQPIGTNELTIKTPWGGVSFKEVSVTGDHVEKLLVVRQATDPSGVLGFEYHHLKDEKLEVKEGLAIFISSDHTAEGWKEGNVTLTFARPGDTCTLHPESEHGVIALTNLVLLETSTCHLDASDLLFVF